MTRAEAKATYEALLEARPPKQSTFPLCTVNTYEGALDEEGRFDGPGAVDSCMGFTYAGDLSHGQIAGQGTMRWADGCSLSGGFQGGIANGPGNIVWPNGDAYVGEVVHGVRHGSGAMTTHGGEAVYTGGWLHSERCGPGRQTYVDGGVYEGEWRGNQRHGRGTLVYASGDCYDGEWVAGSRHGSGAMGWKRGGRRYVELYHGAWEDGSPNGQGRSIYVVHPVEAKSPRREGEDVGPPSAFAPPAAAIVNAYHGAFAGGQRDGWGAFYYADGSCYEGGWAGGKKNGSGKFTSAVGAAHYGVFHDDVPTDIPALSALRAGPAAVPAANISDLCGIGDESAEAMRSKMSSLLLRFNTPLKALFHRYAAMTDGIALAYTPADWWQHRVPGHIGIPQLLRLLSDAGLIDGLVTTHTVLDCARRTAEVELDSACAMTLALANANAHTDGAAESISAPDRTARADGWLNYRQFVETLIRFAPVVCVGVGRGTISDKFNMLVERRLKGRHGDAPLCPLTRQHQSELQPVLPRLEVRFWQLVDLEGRGDGSVTVRGLLRFLRPLLEECGLGLHPAACAMLPFQRRFSAHLPPGLNIAGSEHQAALGHELYTTGCGSDSVGAGSLLVDGVTVEQRLSLVDYVEGIVALVVFIRERLPDGSLDTIIDSKILTLPL